MTNVYLIIFLSFVIIYFSTIIVNQSENTPTVKVTNLIFPDNSTQTTAFAPSSATYDPLFNTLIPSVVGIVSTGSYILISKICYFRVNVNFSAATNFGTTQYKIDLPFKSKTTSRIAGGQLHQITGNSFYHIAGLVDSGSKTLALTYSGSTTDLAWKNNTPVNGTSLTSHFDISGTYEIE
jgi:hypothetical protein